jgi:rRNA maturation protein Rpf1
VTEVKLMMPTAQRINRGAQVLPDLVELCRSNDFTDLVMVGGLLQLLNPVDPQHKMAWFQPLKQGLCRRRGEQSCGLYSGYPGFKVCFRSSNLCCYVTVHEHRGEPDGLVISHMPFGPTAYFGLSNTVMRHDIKDEDIGHVSEANPHIILENFSTALGKRTATILKHLFPPPKDKSKRVITFANNADYISMRWGEGAAEQGASSCDPELLKAPGFQPFSLVSALESCKCDIVSSTISTACVGD